MIFNLQLILYSTFDRRMYDNQINDMLLSVLDYFLSKLKESNLVISIDEHQSSVMLESNQRITLQFQADFKDNTKKDEIKKMILSFVPEKLCDFVSFDVANTDIRVNVPRKKSNDLGRLMKRIQSKKNGCSN